ncbi:MAG TPA: redoxin domain-containing protein [Gemmatimonadales bacterium]|nr:redoxin domain-containing protein [Gemmatimonadales bacterium]
MKIGTSILVGTAVVLVVAGTAAIRPAAPGGGGTPAPELTNTSWLNSDHPLRLAELRDRVVLLNFWVFTCGNCTRTVPSLVEYDRKYRDQGLTIIGIHTPEFPPYAGEHDKGNLARALARQGITYPNAQDNDRHTWDAYGIEYWPSFVLIDKRGIIRYTGYGEFHLDDGDYREWDRRIRQLLAERVPLIAIEAGPPASLRLVAAPGVRINARLKPALELDDGSVLRFDSPSLTPDSAYFAAPPTAAPVPPGGPHRGILRASVCPSREKFCRAVELAVTW